jgi:hypothetical protein
MRNAWLALTLVLAACDPGQGAGAAAPCPPCECKCDCAGADQQQTASTQQPSNQQPVADHRTELTELTTSASRKMMHGDGAGCLADLDRIDALDPVLGKQLLITRAQCRMANGECQQGKQQLVDWYMREQAFTREFAERAAEGIASMRCRGGDATDRDRLLAALFDLSDGAYMNKRDVAFCQDRVAIVESLAPKVKPRDAEDTQISGGIQALFHTSAMCFARAGDCQTAYTYYRRLFPADGLSAIPDPAQRESIVRSSFDSSIALCQP